MTSGEGATGDAGGTPDPTARPDDVKPADVGRSDAGSFGAGPRGSHDELVDVGPADVDAEDEAPGLDAAGPGSVSVGSLDQSSEEAVAEAVELAQNLERQRDEYLDHLRRLQADFENYKRRVSTQAEEQRTQAAVNLVRELLPVLDAVDAAVEHGSEEVPPLRNQLLQTLEKQGLVVLGESGVPFDPNVHEAVLHEEGEGDAVVTDIMRTGYLWNGRVVRAAMVKVRG